MTPSNTVYVCYRGLEYEDLLLRDGRVQLISHHASRDHLHGRLDHDIPGHGSLRPRVMARIGGSYRTSDVAENIPEKYSKSFSIVFLVQPSIYLFKFYF